jgi:hypothetical protein
MSSEFNSEDKDVIVPSASDITQEQLATFLDELTSLTRKYGLEISSEGSVDIPSIRLISHAKANSGRYLPFWTHVEQQEHVKTPTEIFFTADAELENVVRFDDEDYHEK